MNEWLGELWYQFNFGLHWAFYTLGWSLRCTGAHNVPRTGPMLVLANHESFLDPVAVGIAVRRRIHYLARKPLFKNPIFGKYLRSVGCVPVDQLGVAKEGLRMSIDLLQAGKALLVFPEGERTWTGKMQPFKPGLSLILKKVPVPILPVGIAGAFEAYPRTAKFPKLSPLFWPATGAGLAAAVGKPIPPEVYAKMGREEMLEYFFLAVQEETEKAKRLVRR